MRYEPQDIKGQMYLMKTHTPMSDGKVLEARLIGIGIPVLRSANARII